MSNLSLFSNYRGYISSRDDLDQSHYFHEIDKFATAYVDKVLTPKQRRSLRFKGQDAVYNHLIKREHVFKLTRSLIAWIRSRLKDFGFNVESYKFIDQINYQNFQPVFDYIIEVIYRKIVNVVDNPPEDRRPIPGEFLLSRAELRALAMQRNCRYGSRSPRKQGPRMDKRARRRQREFEEKFFYDGYYHGRGDRT